MKPSILVVGATGFIGQALVKRLSRNHSVICWVRDLEKAKTLLGDPVTLVTSLDQVSEPVKTVFNLAGAPIMDKAWSAARKETLYRSRVGVTKDVVTWMSGLKEKPEALVQGSAVGYFGDRGEEELNETSLLGTGYLSELCDSWEQAALEAEALGVRVVLARTSMVLASGGGALDKILPPFLAFVGGPFGSGSQWMPWIHLADELQALELLSRDVSLKGPFNLVAPGQRRSTEFAQDLGAALHRPSWLKAPKFALKTLLGDRAQMLLCSQRIVPQRLIDAGFVFSYPQLDGAFTEIFS